MAHLEFVFKIIPFQPGSEILISLLDKIGFDGFVEEENALNAYVPIEKFDQTKLNGIINEDLKPFSINYTFCKLHDKNWNEEWEKNYDYVVIDDKVLIKAPFHKIDKKYPYEILIEPKMSFGTAHHPTTKMMIRQMFSIDFRNKFVLDMGCGTGVLAILASILGAANVVGIDNDQYAFDNARENIDRNKIPNAEILHGDSDLLSNSQFDILLANINRNIILQDINKYEESLKPKSTLVLSGFIFQDKNHIFKAVERHGFKEVATFEENDWISIQFARF